MAACHSTTRGRSRWIRRRQSRQRATAVGSLAVCGLVAVAFAVPATAGAKTSKPVLMAEARTNMRIETKFDETHHIIPFKRGTTFTITCGFQGRNILCREHHGPERCVKGKPWLQLSDIFPVIKGRVGQSLAYGLTSTSIYCRTPALR